MEENNQDENEDYYHRVHLPMHPKVLNKIFSAIFTPKEGLNIGVALASSLRNIMDYQQEHGEQHPLYESFSNAYVKVTIGLDEETRSKLKNIVAKKYNMGFHELPDDPGDLPEGLFKSQTTHILKNIMKKPEEKK